MRRIPSGWRLELGRRALFVRPDLTGLRLRRRRAARARDTRSGGSGLDLPVLFSDFIGEEQPVRLLQRLQHLLRNRVRLGIVVDVRVEPVHHVEMRIVKKLFHDPHFNVMDGLDTYIDDYSKPDPIPEEMLKSLKQANRLLFPDEVAEEDGEIQAGAAGTGVASAGSAPPAEAQPRQVGSDEERAAPELESPPARDATHPSKPA